MLVTPVEKVWIDMAAFIIDTDNEIKEDPPGSGEYKNSGETRRKGLEFATRYRPVEGLELFADFSIIDTEILESPDSSLKGKEVSGIPETIFNLGLKYTAPNGLGTRVKWRNVGEYYVDSANTQKYDGYDVVDASIFYDISDKKGVKYKISLDVDNLFDEHYSQAVWSGYGTTNYALSWPRTFWLGIKMEW
jgi:outer membrane receptor protein involved in Fe transport